MFSSFKNVRLALFVNNHRHISTQSTQLDGIPEITHSFYAYGCLYVKCKVTITYVASQYMMDLSVNGYLQTVGMVDDLDDVLDWIENSLKNKITLGYAENTGNVGG